MLDYDGPPSNCSKETTEDDAVSVTLATLDHGSPGLQRHVDTSRDETYLINSSQATVMARADATGIIRTLSLSHEPPLLAPLVERARQQREISPAALYRPEQLRPLLDEFQTRLDSLMSTTARVADAPSCNDSSSGSCRVAISSIEERLNLKHRPFQTSCSTASVQDTAKQSPLVAPIDLSRAGLKGYGQGALLEACPASFDEKPLGSKGSRPTEAPHVSTAQQADQKKVIPQPSPKISGMLGDCMQKLNEKLRDNHVFILQKTARPAGGLKTTKCFSPSCTKRRKRFAPGSYRMSLEPRVNLILPLVPERSVGDQAQQDGMNGEEAAIALCLDCLEALCNHVGLWQEGEDQKSSSQQPEDRCPDFSDGADEAQGAKTLRKHQMRNSPTYGESSSAHTEMKSKIIRRASGMTPFQRLYSSIYPETRDHRRGYSTLPIPQQLMVHKWKSAMKRLHMFENPHDFAFPEHHWLNNVTRDLDPDFPLDLILSASEDTLLALADISGLIMGLNFKELHDKELTVVMDMVDQQLHLKLLDRMGRMASPMLDVVRSTSESY